MSSVIWSFLLADYMMGHDSDLEVSCVNVSSINSMFLISLTFWVGIKWHINANEGREV